MCFPFVAFGAPSVRALGIKNAVMGGKAESKVVPVKMTAGAGATAGNTSGSGVARVGSLRARATTTGQVGSATSVSSRFPAILPTKIYNTAATPRPTGGGSAINNAAISDLENNLSDLEQRVTNIENIENNTSNITTQVNENTQNIQNLQNDDRFDSIRRVGAGEGAPFSGEPDTDEPRAWIWVEVPTSGSGS